MKIIKEQTIEGIIEHHRILGDATRAAVKALGLELFSKARGNILTAVKTPEELDGKELVNLMQKKYSAYISGAQDPMKGKFFRIAHLGYMGGFDVIIAISALEMVLSEMGYKVEAGKGVAAAEEVLRREWK